MSTATKPPSYKEGLHELRNHLSRVLPPAALQAFDKDADSLGRNLSSVLKLYSGDKAPDFCLSNAKGEMVKLSDLLKKEKVVLTFYRGTWCPYCNLQLSQYQQVLPEIHSLGARLVAISPQTPDESLNFQEKNELQFEVLSDNGNMVARKYTTVFKNGAAPIKAMSDLGYDFKAFYSDDSAEIPVPAVFIIEQNGTISFAKATGGDYRNRVEAQEIIDSLKKN